MQNVCIYDPTAKARRLRVHVADLHRSERDGRFSRYAFEDGGIVSFDHLPGLSLDLTLELEVPNREAGAIR
ncbi:hypothetical protein D3C80_2188600 [compost metagenome]